jgi:predicted RNA-binding Zn-ribbon protein involved in translation (DUF1610 family)
MEVLREGKTVEKKKAEFECGNCKSLLRAAFDEGTLHQDQRDGDYVLFKCPVCSGRIYIDARKFK